MKDLKRLANLGFTNQGAAIVDAVWFTDMNNYQIGIVLIFNPSGIWKAYICSQVDITSEENDAQLIAKNGAKVPYAIAKAAFPNHDFDINCYDCEETIA
jgi:hypothetical protein